jgi:acetyl-CoA C-acetyltransferase
VGITPVNEHWGTALRDLGVSAIDAALDDAGVKREDIDALVVGNALGGSLNRQSNLAALIADYAGMRGVEALRVEAADASGGVAIRQAVLMVASGAARTVLALGVEKVTDLVGPARNNALATQLDAEYESSNGATPTAMAGILMRRYMHEFGLQLAQFEGFSINAHANGSKNPNAMYRNLIKAGRFASAPIVAPPVNLFDSAPEGDGACAVIVTASERAADMVPLPIRITGSAAAGDGFALHDRIDPLFLAAANRAAGRAYEMAGIRPQDIDVLELHDAYTVLSAMQLEATGFASRGEGWKLAADGAINADGALPISTFGGLKARGHAIGATGVYQVAEVVLQLRGQAGDNQIADVKRGMALNLGGLGSAAVAHILEG